MHLGLSQEALHLLQPHMLGIPLTGEVEEYYQIHDGVWKPYKIGSTASPILRFLEPSNNVHKGFYGVVMYAFVPWMLFGKSFETLLLLIFLNPTYLDEMRQVKGQCLIFS